MVSGARCECCGETKVPFLPDLYTLTYAIAPPAVDMQALT